MTEDMRDLHFIFTENDFYPDSRAGKEQKPDSLSHRFEEDRYRALYQMGFEQRGELTATGCYLYQISEAFLQCLAGLPELELARENAKPEPDRETINALLLSVPFAIGAEYVTEKWILTVFGKLTAVFADEIQRFDGTDDYERSVAVQSLPESPQAGADAKSHAAPIASRHSSPLPEKRIYLAQLHGRAGVRRLSGG